MTWKELIQTTTVAELVKAKEKKLIVIQKGTTLKDALHTLHDQNIMGAPVVDYSQNATLGFVDVLDIAGYVLSTWRYMYSDRPQERNFARDEFFHHPIESVLNFSRCDFPATISDHLSVADLIQMFCAPGTHSRLHRVAVMNKSGQLSSVVSQSDLIAFAHKNSHLLPFSDKSVAELGLVHSCIMVRLDSEFYSTLEVLYSNKISGLALTDENGKISGNFSASDLRGLTQKSFNYFTGSTLQFLVKGTDSGLGAPITCVAATHLKDVLKTLTEQHLHRVYVIDQYDRAAGVITMTDIIHLLRPRSS